MKTASAPKPPGFAWFRVKLLLAMMAVVSAVMGPALFVSQRDASATAEREREQSFQNEVTLLRSLQELRHAVLAERSRQLARKPRIHAALEDNALDLLYPSAHDELVDIMQRDAAAAGSFADALQARFYRFLDHDGKVIPPPDASVVGNLESADEDRLSLAAVPSRPQMGYLVHEGTGRNPLDAIDEVTAVPIYSSETGAPIAALVLGFKPFDLAGRRSPLGVKFAIWTNGRLLSPDLDAAAAAALQGQLETATRATGNLTVELGGIPWLVFHQLLNPGSSFPPVHEVFLYPLSEARAAQRVLFWKFVGVWAMLLLVALVASHLLASRLSRPVEKLAVDSLEDRSQRRRAEAALEHSHEELQRSARFSADASHQLKTPVTVLRVGLEELLAGEKLTGEVREEVSSLVHQTFRLTSVIEDLLLLSRLDAGRLKLDFHQVDLTRLIEAALDDLESLPNDRELKIESELPGSLLVAGEQRYLSLILQNLLENARKYNRADGRIRLSARREERWALFTVGNTGSGIPPAAQEHVFERFHRGTAGENLPGHGLGLNLARELARLHQGELRLVESADDWTEFEVRLPLVVAAVAERRAAT